MTQEFEPELSIASAVIQAIDARLRDVWTSLPGVITSWDSDRQLATVEPTIKDPDGARLPAVVGVRVVQPLAGSVGVALPVAAGVQGLLVCCTLDASGWLLRGGSPAEVRSQARHKLSYAVFVPGVGPSAPEAPERPTIGNLSNTSHPIAMGDRVQAIFDLLDSALTGATPGPSEPGFAAFKAAWLAPVSGYASQPSVSSDDADVTT